MGLIRLWYKVAMQIGDHSRLILGTAQLGLNYGLANKSGKPDKLMAFEILNKALEYGIDAFDTQANRASV